MTQETETRCGGKTLKLRNYYPYKTEVTCHECGKGKLYVIPEIGKHFCPCGWSEK